MLHVREIWESRSYAVNSADEALRSCPLASLPFYQSIVAYAHYSEHGVWMPQKVSCVDCEECLAEQ